MIRKLRDLPHAILIFAHSVLDVILDRRMRSGWCGIREEWRISRNIASALREWQEELDD